MATVRLSAFAAAVGIALFGAAPADAQYYPHGGWRHQQPGGWGYQHHRWQAQPYGYRYYGYPGWQQPSRHYERPYTRGTEQPYGYRDRAEDPRDRGDCRFDPRSGWDCKRPSTATRTPTEDDAEAVERDTVTAPPRDVRPGPQKPGGVPDVDHDDDDDRATQRGPGAPPAVEDDTDTADAPPPRRPAPPPAVEDDTDTADAPPARRPGPPPVEDDTADTDTDTDAPTLRGQPPGPRGPVARVAPPAPQIEEPSVRPEDESGGDLPPRRLAPPRGVPPQAIAPRVAPPPAPPRAAAPIPRPAAPRPPKAPRVAEPVAPPNTVTPSRADLGTFGPGVRVQKPPKREIRQIPLP